VGMGIFDTRMLTGRVWIS